MNEKTARDLMNMAPAQAAYALALSIFEAAKSTAEEEKAARGVNYADDMSEADLDAMCEAEAKIEIAAGVDAARAALRTAETKLIAWGIDHACATPGMSEQQAAELRGLRDAAAIRVVVREKVVALCFRLAA